MIKNPELEILRTELESINLNFLEMLDKRQKIVTQIQTVKKESSTKNIWVPERELSLFKKYDELNPTDIKKDLIYSLIIESQAKVSADYPEWSAGEHLENSELNLNNMMNPILLFIRNRSEYQKLKLSKHYNLILKDLLKDEI
ncbi:MAG: chorismate mutase [Bacteriovoracaceae bacterium]|jgi:chorismate mutase